MIEACRAKSQRATDKESIVASLGVSGLTAEVDHSAAARELRTAPLAQRVVSDQADLMRTGVKLSLADLMQTDAPMPAEVRLEGVRVLSCSKSSCVPMRKGKSKSKGKGKDKSNGKSKMGKDGKVGKTDSALQDAKVVYIGQGKHVIAIAAFGDDVCQVDDSLLGCLVDVQGLRPRAGQLGTLYWSESQTF